MSIWDWLLNPAGLTAHGFCLSWAPGLVALHAGSDAAVGLAYLSIPLALGNFIHRRPDLKYGWVAYLFVAFILACGATHLFSILTLWVPAYGVEGLVKLLTAVLSIATATILWTLLPKAIALPSATQLAEANSRLAATIVGQQQTAALLRESEDQVRKSNSELERRVAERTSQLTAANARLTDVLAERVREQAALARSETEFRASFEAAAVGKAQSDPLTGRILRANRAFAHMLGYEPEDLVGRVGWEFTWPEDRDAEMAAFARVLAGRADVYVRRSAICAGTAGRSGGGSRRRWCDCPAAASRSSPSRSSRTSRRAIRRGPPCRPPPTTWKSSSRSAPPPWRSGTCC